MDLLLDGTSRTRPLLLTISRSIASLWQDWQSITKVPLRPKLLFSHTHNLLLFFQQENDVLVFHPSLPLPLSSTLEIYPIHLHLPYTVPLSSTRVTSSISPCTEFCSNTKCHAVLSHCVQSTSRFSCSLLIPLLRSLIDCRDYRRSSLGSPFSDELCRYLSTYIKILSSLSFSHPRREEPIQMAVSSTTSGPQSFRFRLAIYRSTCFGPKIYLISSNRQAQKIRYISRHLIQTIERSFQSYLINIMLYNRLWMFVLFSLRMWFFLFWNMFSLNEMVWHE